LCYENGGDKREEHIVKKNWRRETITMINVVSELYIEVYWFLHGSFKNEKAIRVIDILFLTLLQIANIYSLIALAQRAVNVQAIKFIFNQPMLVITICSLLAFVNVWAAKNAKNKIREDDKVRYIKRRLTFYMLISIVLFIAAVFLPASNT
jgi:hypothetical protein